MKLAIFAKRRQVIDENTGKARDFYTFLTTLINRESGEPLPVQVKFREACGAPDPATCPCFIEVPKGKANLSWDSYENDEGEKLQAAKMWVTAWTPAGEYEDHSLDAYDAYTGV